MSIQHDTDNMDECSACNYLDDIGTDIVEMREDHDYYWLEDGIDGMRERGEMRDGTPLQI